MYTNSDSANHSQHIALKTSILGTIIKVPNFNKHWLYVIANVQSIVNQFSKMINTPPKYFYLRKIKLHLARQ
jgi:hypothetical protein